MPWDINARRFYRVAYQRLEDGTLLLERLQRPNAAVYLAGYAVECMLKALLLVSVAPGERSAMMGSFRGSIAHDVLWLRDRLATLHVHVPAPVAGELTYVSSWSTDLRYEPGIGDPEDAERFLDATRVVVNWADGRI